MYKLIKDIFNADKFIIIIVDACRYDIFSNVYNQYLEGTLYRMNWNTSCTPDFIVKYYMDYIDAVYISANGFIIDRNVNIPKYIKYNGSKHFKKVIPTFITGWDSYYNTVLPKYVYYDTINNLYDRIIIHFIQPHAPYRSFKFLKMNEKHLTNIYRENHSILSNIINAYISNLKWAMGYIKKLVDIIKIRPIIVTADHGELLGEDNMIDHPCKYKHEKLNNIPYLIIS